MEQKQVPDLFSTYGFISIISAERHPLLDIGLRQGSPNIAPVLRHIVVTRVHIPKWCLNCAKK